MICRFVEPFNVVDLHYLPTITKQSFLHSIFYNKTFFECDQLCICEMSS